MIINGCKAALLASAVLIGACAQNPAGPPPLPDGAPMWQQGRAPALSSSSLAPLAGKLTMTPPSEIPLQTLKMPAGFKAEVWASGIPGARAMVRGASGKVYVGTRGIGRVYEISDGGNARTSRVVVDKLNQPAGVEIRNGSLYVMAVDKVLRFDGIEANAAAPAVDMTAVFKLPVEQHHNWKYLRFGPDGKLYVPFGAPCNICVPPSGEYAQIRRYNADGSGMEVLATGVRNTVGFDFHPVTGELWFSNHGRDWLGDDTPDDTLNRLSAKGQNYGFPYCHAGNLPDQDFAKPNACNGVAQPVQRMGPHTAVMGVHFYTGSMFPAEYRNVAFVARKGSWNRSVKSGFDVVAVRANNDGTNAQITPFISGFANAADQSFWGRPTYMLQMPDGALLLSDEQTGAIYRISYSR